MLRRCGWLAFLAALASLAYACGDDTSGSNDGSGGNGTSASGGSGTGASTGGVCEEPPSCQTYTDCCHGTNCLLETCLGDCNPEAACTSTISDCCGGQFCVDGNCQDFCGNDGQTCDTDSDCCADTCVDGVCRDPSKGIGDPCETNDECLSGDCMNSFHWCTQDCTSDSDCDGVNAAGTLNACSSAGKCYPTCDGNADCTEFPHPACASTSAVPEGACISKNLNGTKGTGDVCDNDDECISKNCVGWCSDSCNDNQDCGINDAGFLVWCLNDSSSGTQQCFPGCNSDSDCEPFGQNYVCLSVGQNIDVCSLP